MLPHDTDASLTSDAEQVTQHTEEAGQFARIHITKQQSADARRCNLRHRQVEYKPGDQVWVWTPICRQGLSEKLLSRYFGPYKVIRRVSEVNYEVIPDGAASSTALLRDSACCSPQTVFRVLRRRQPVLI